MLPQFQVDAMNFAVCFVEMGNIQARAGFLATKLPAKLATHLKMQCCIPLGSRHAVPERAISKAAPLGVTDLSFNTR